MTLDESRFVPFWEDEPDIWDEIIFDGFAMPGLAIVSASIGRKIDTKSASGSDGATLTDKGYEPGKVDIKLVLWTREQLEDYLRVRPRRRPNEPRRPIAVEHPALELLNIRSIYINELSSPTPGTVKGTREITIKAIEYRPPTRRNVTRTPRVPASDLATRNSAIGGTPRVDANGTPTFIQFNSATAPSASGNGP
jgi:hypothetical protein